MFVASLCKGMDAKIHSATPKNPPTQKAVVDYKKKYKNISCSPLRTQSPCPKCMWTRRFLNHFNMCENMLCYFHSIVLIDLCQHKGECMKCWMMGRSFFYAPPLQLLFRLFTFKELWRNYPFSSSLEPMEAECVWPKIPKKLAMTHLIWEPMLFFWCM